MEPLPISINTDAESIIVVSVGTCERGARHKRRRNKKKNAAYSNRIGVARDQRQNPLFMALRNWKSGKKRGEAEPVDVRFGEYSK